jgi:hypothetical protein
MASYVPKFENSSRRDPAMERPTYSDAKSPRDGEHPEATLGKNRSPGTMVPDAVRQQ